MKNRKIIFTLLLGSICFWSQAQSTSGYEPGFYLDHGDTLHYQILWPENFNPDKTYPLVLFLHGAGERGHDNKIQLVHGGQLFEDLQKQYPSIVIFPQCPKDDYWSNVNIVRDENGKRQFHFLDGGTPTHAMQEVLDMMDSLVRQPFVKKERVYEGGLSMGGMGSFEIISRRPDMFAAAFAICGGANPATAKRIAHHTPLWIFHGGKDDIVNPEHAKKMAAAIKKLGGEVKFTLYPEANHNSWDSAFAEPNLPTWLFSHTKDAKNEN